MPRKASRKQRKQRKLRRKATRRQHFRQRGGDGTGLQLLEGADTIPIAADAPAPAALHLQVQYLPLHRATEDGPQSKLEDSSSEPHTTWNANPGTLYTVICWDPDAPAKSYLHWLVINCTKGDANSGEVVVPWSPPLPPKGTGEHRYIVGLFRQDAGHLSAIDKLERVGFHPASFAQVAQLSAIAYKGVRVKAPA